MMRVAAALARREFTRFIRQPQRVVGSVAQPVLFWIFMGAGFTGSFRPPGMEGVTYLEYFYPGVMLMMLLFASIFSSITIIEDRDQGFLQSVLVAPVSRLAIVLGKVFGAASIGLSQVLLFAMAAPFLGLSMPFGSVLLLLGGMVLASVGFAALGFLVAWGLRSTAGFHAIMMVFLMPLWMLSGALFPVAGGPGWLGVVVAANPVSHALTLLRAPFYAGPAELFTTPSYLISLAVTLTWAGGCLAASMWRVERRERGAPITA
ncbi:MAG: ABC transporter permease [Alphaproteobacteria bacterium]|nr:ABC transporter permease [Alphaproteobacteria bacterium]